MRDALIAMVLFGAMVVATAVAAKYDGSCLVVAPVYGAYASGFYTGKAWRRRSAK